MLTITIEEVFVHGLDELLGFTEEGVSFLHLSEEEFKSAKKIGTEEQITRMEEEYYQQKSVKK